MSSQAAIINSNGFNQQRKKQTSSYQLLKRAYIFMGHLVYDDLMNVFEDTHSGCQINIMQKLFNDK